MIGIILLAQAMAQSPDRDLIKKVEDKFGEPPRYGNEARENKLRYPLPDQGPEMEEILSSPIVQKTVVRGGSIYDLNEEKSYGATSPMIIDVHQKTDHYGYFYIVGFSGEITKRVHMRHALDIKDDIEMYEPPKTYSVVKERKNVSPFDKNFTHRPEATVAYGLSSSPWIADILDDSKANQGQGYRLGGRWLVDLAEKFQLGGVFNFEASNYLTTRGDARYRNISFGVAGKTNTLDWGGFASRFIGEIRLGPFGNLTTTVGGQSQSVDVRTTSLLLGWEFPSKNFFGEWSWGVSYQRDFPKLRNQKIYIAQNSNSSIIDTFSLHLSQGFDW